MSRSVRWAVVVGVVIFLGMLALLLYSMTTQYAELCRACVTFRGRTECREAWGPTAEEATQTAVDNACGLLARGMTDSIACGRTPPDSVSCEE